MKTNYAAFTARINKTKTLADCAKLEKSWERLFNAGIFTTNEAMRLDCKIMDKRIALGQYS